MRIITKCYSLIKPLALVALCSLLLACSVKQHLTGAKIDLPKQFKYQIDSNQAAKLSANQPWWYIFDDEVLAQLIELSNANNNTIARTLLHYQELEANLVGSKAEGRPFLRLMDTGAKREWVNKSRGHLTLKANSGLNWQLDLWGKIRENIAIAQSVLVQGVQQSRRNVYAIQVLVAEQYFLVRHLDHNIAVQQQNLRQYKLTQNLAQQRYEHKTASRADGLQADIQLQRQELYILELQKQRRLAENALATLVGTIPTNWHLGEMQLISELPSLPLVLSLALLNQRPDIAAVQQQLAIDNSRLGLAMASWLPDVSLNLSLGREGKTLKSLIKGDTVWSFVPRVNWDIFDFGRRTARKQRAELVLQQTLLTYRDTVLTAVREIEDILVSHGHSQQQYQRQKRLVKLAEDNNALLLQAYQNAKVNYFEVNNAQQLQREQQVEQLATKLQIQQQIVQLALAIGGKWSTN